MKARTLTILAVLALLSVFAIAGVVGYLSNTVNATATVASPIEVEAVATVNDVEMPLDAITAFGGETIVLAINTENLSSVAQACDLTITAEPAIETTDGELTTEIIKTVELDAYANEDNTYEIELVPEYTGTVAIDLVCNVVAEEEPPVVE